MVSAIRSVAAGKICICIPITGIYKEEYVTQLSKNTHSDCPELTDRQKRVLILEAYGKTVREISKILGIKEKTAEKHTENIKERLGISTKAGLVKYAVREGLVDLT